MLVALLLLTRVAFGFASRERRLPSLLAGQAATQILLHATFVLAGARSHPAHEHLAHGHLAQGHLAHGTGLGLRMTMAHGVATLCVALLLRHAERVLWFAARLSPRTIVTTLLSHVTAARPTPIPPIVKIDVRRQPPKPHTRPLGRVARRRGPPFSPRLGLFPQAA